MSYWSNRKEYHEELNSYKSCNGAYKFYAATSGLASSGGGSQVIQFIGCNPTSTKRAIKNITLSGKIKITGGATLESSGNTSIEFIKDLNNALNVLVSINGQCSYQSNNHFLTPLVKSYMEKYKSVLDYSKQSLYYPNKITKSSTGSPTFVDEINFSCPLIHPFFMGECVGGIKDLQITLFVDNSLFSLFKLTATQTISASTVVANISECNLEYQEYDIDSDDFSIEIPYFQIIPKENTTSTDVQNITGIAIDSFILYALNGALFNQYNPYATSRTLNFSKTYGIKIDINNTPNVYNTRSLSGMYSRCKELGYLGEFSDFAGSLVENEFSQVVRISNKTIPYDLQTPDIYRFYAYDVNYEVPADAINDAQFATKYHPTLCVIHYYKALLHLSPDVNEYKFFKNDDFVNISDGSNDDEIEGGGWLSNLGKAGMKFLKNGGISKLANTVSAVSSMIPGAKSEKVSNISGLVGNIGENLGLSASVF